MLWARAVVIAAYLGHEPMQKHCVFWATIYLRPAALTEIKEAQHFYFYPQGKPHIFLTYYSIAAITEFMAAIFLILRCLCMFTSLLST